MKSTKHPLVLLVLAAFFTFMIATAWAAPGGEVPGHQHMFPYTKVLGDHYHLRLIVDPYANELLLIFEDISEKAVEIMPFKTIDAEVIFLGGERKEIKFKSMEEARGWTHPDAHPVFRLGRRMAGKYEYRADWIKDSVDFDLIVSFPFQGKDYKFVFDYSTGAHMFPYNMGR